MKGQYLSDVFAELRKSGGVAFSADQIARFIDEGENEKVLSKEEVRQIVIDYFTGLTAEQVDPETGEITLIWTRPPTKSGLCLALGVSRQVLIDTIRGEYRPGRTYQNRADKGQKIHSDARPILKTAYELITSFYEEGLSANKNNIGVIYWLNNCSRDTWSNETQVTIAQGQQENVQIVETTGEIAAKYQTAALMPPEETEE